MFAFIFNPNNSLGILTSIPSHLSGGEGEKDIDIDVLHF